MLPLPPPPAFPHARMSDPHPNSSEHLERARELLWEGIERLEEAQRVLFKAGDCYVAQVRGDGVRTILEITERITHLTGDVTSVHIELGRMARADRREGG
jgi:hypothetical protein